MTPHLKRLTLPVLLLVGLSACDEATSPTAVEPDFARSAQAEDRAQNTKAAPSPTIVDIAVAAASDEQNPEFTILVQAVLAAGLADELSAKGQLTVFAPTDAAFGRLLDLLGVSAEELLADTDLLTSVLLYHVAPGERFSGDVLGSERIRTLNGAFLFPVVNANGAFIVDGNDATEDAQLLAPDLIDIEASNGVIHVIDEVLLF
jgi:transforming growth factor-beta-induced protein